MLNLFVASMLVLVLGNGFLTLYLGWEGVGLASYLLIGFYVQRPLAASAAKKAGRICLCFTGNGVPLRQQWQSVRDELRLIRVFHELGIRMMHLTYNRRNPIGDGAGERGGVGFRTHHDLELVGHEGVLEVRHVELGLGGFGGGVGADVADDADLDVLPS